MRGMICVLLRYAIRKDHIPASANSQDLPKLVNEMQIGLDLVDAIVDNKYAQTSIEAKLRSLQSPFISEVLDEPERIFVESISDDPVKSVSTDVTNNYDQLICSMHRCPIVIGSGLFPSFTPSSDSYKISADIP